MASPVKAVSSSCKRTVEDLRGPGQGTAGEELCDVISIPTRSFL